MKRAILFIALALSVTLLFSCYWISGFSSGSLRLDLSGLADKGLYDRYARIWLVTNDMIFPLGEEKDYVQKFIPGSEEVTVTLEDIPAVKTYRVWVSVVIQEEDGFSTDAWAESPEFLLSPGDEVAVIFEIEDFNFSPFIPVIDTDAELTKLGNGLTDVEAYLQIGVPPLVYATDGAKLYEIFSFYSSPSVVPVGAPGGHIINSVSSGINRWASSVPVVDTNTDIVPYNGDLEYDSTITTNLPPVSILDSASDDFVGGKVEFFRRKEGWGGTYANFDITDPDQWIWLNHDSAKIFDMEVSQDGSGYAYFSSAEGAFRFSGDYLYTTFLEGAPKLDDYIDGFQAPAKILSLGLINPEVPVLLLGTENGVYEAGMTSGPEVITSPFIVEGTQGYRIHKIATYYYWPNYAAYLSDAYLLIWDGNSYLLEKYPLCAGIPGRITAMTWAYSADTGSYYLIISGDEGLVFKEFVLG